MNYHIPVEIIETPIPQFAEKNGEIVCPQKTFSKREYPTLPYDLVKIVSRDGRNIYINRAKLSAMDA